MSRTVTCDQCKGDLTDAGATTSFMLTLTSSSMPTTSPYRYALHVTPAIPVGTYDFCGESCLTLWLSSRST